MRCALLAIAVVACTRTDEASQPPAPAVAPVPPPLDKAGTDDLATQIDDTTAATACNLFVASSSAGLANERTIPLASVSWTLGTNWQDRTTLTATCQQPRCIHGRQQSRTLEIPHTYSWHHDERQQTTVVVAPHADGAKVLAGLERIGKRCKQAVAGDDSRSRRTR